MFDRKPPVAWSKCGKAAIEIRPSEVVPTVFQAPPRMSEGIPIWTAPKVQVS